MGGSYLIARSCVSATLQQQPHCLFVPISSSQVERRDSALLKRRSESESVIAVPPPCSSEGYGGQEERVKRDKRVGL